MESLVQSLVDLFGGLSKEIIEERENVNFLRDILPMCINLRGLPKGFPLIFIFRH